MYVITKLSPKSQQFIAEINAQNKGKQLPVTISLARLIAYDLPLPTAKVEDIQGFLNTQHGVDVRLRLGQLNEILFIDHDAVMDYVHRFYGFRYNQIDTPKTLLLKPETAVLDLFRIRRSFDDTSLTCIQENSDYISRLTNCFIQLLTDISTGA